MKEQKGITLIALVITIIVLLILAGVTIAMLVGQNGILTNSNKASCENAYRGADEQMKLAYMAVRTQIMAETVKDSTYDARLYAAATTGENATPEVPNLKNLANIVKKDLSSSSFVVKYTPQAKTSANKAYICIEYSDNKLDAGLVDGTHPLQDSKVYGYIEVDKQSASYKYDIDDTSAGDCKAKFDAATNTATGS